MNTNPQPTHHNRRDILKWTLATGASALGLAACASNQRSPHVAAAPRKRTVRLAHFTDFHIQPELDAAKGVASALHHAQSMPDAPSLIVTGGDLVMDAYDQQAPRAREVFDLFTATLRSDCSIPVHHTLGNHDIWGWNKPKSGLTGNEPLYGKAYALDRLAMTAPYHFFDVGPAHQGGWRVIVLDSIRPSRKPGDIGYEAFLDEPQRAWLESVLQETPKDRWMMVVSHVPILSACSLFDSDPGTPLRIHTSLIHADARSLHDLFTRHTNVRLALSGHIHQNDRIDYDGLTYICGGAVCGAWWKGANQNCHEGFGIIDLYDDGTHDYRYETYGWKSRA